MKKRQLVLSALARADLRYIHAYISEHNPAAADKFVLDLYRKMHELAELGLSGVSRNWLKPGLRALSYRDRSVYFRVTDSHIHVVRILHGRQDASPDDFPESET
ncbi:MAG: type II toxin-antitoxin system RelE/ParE family toxin [Shinella sp.]|nr:type II toxin-antitoxin system RelE/ParE family toxin [Shinella sp.]